jgi:hypothetical protein
VIDLASQISKVFSKKRLGRPRLIPDEPMRFHRKQPNIRQHQSCDYACQAMGVLGLRPESGRPPPPPSWLVDWEAAGRQGAITWSILAELERLAQVASDEVVTISPSGNANCDLQPRKAPNGCAGDAAARRQLEMARRCSLGWPNASTTIALRIPDTPTAVLRDAVKKLYGAISLSVGSTMSGECPPSVSPDRIADIICR